VRFQGTSHYAGSYKSEIDAAHGVNYYCDKFGLPRKNPEIGDPPEDFIPCRKRKPKIRKKKKQNKASLLSKRETQSTLPKEIDAYSSESDESEEELMSSRNHVKQEPVEDLNLHEHMKYVPILYQSEEDQMVVYETDLKIRQPLRYKDGEKKCYKHLIQQGQGGMVDDEKILRRREQILNNLFHVRKDQIVSITRDRVRPRVSMKKKQGGSGYCILPEAEFGCCAFLVWYILSSDSAKGDVVCAIIYSSQAKGKPWSHAKHVLNDHHFQNACKLSGTIYEDLGAAGITFSEYHSKIRHRLLVREKYRFGYRKYLHPETREIIAKEYLNVLTPCEVQFCEYFVDEQEKKRKEGRLKSDTFHESNKRVKHWYGRKRYKWNDMPESHDIDDIPHFARIVEEKFNKKFVETIKGLRSIHHNEFSINVYEPYCKGLEAHFDGKQKADDRSEFVGEIFSMRLFSNSRLVFGPRGQGNMFSVKDHEYDLPLRVGNMISFDAESQMEKHAIRMEHLKAKSASLIFRNFRNVDSDSDS